MIQAVTQPKAFSVKEWATFLDCCPGNTSRKRDELERACQSALLASPEAWASSRRPDRIWRAVKETATKLLRFEAAAPEAFDAWFASLVESV